MIRIGVDVGGTFTDLVSWDERSGALAAVKVPSTPRREQDGFLDGLRSLGGAADGIEQIIHGTTVATNALLQRKGGRVALLTTAGFRDVLEIGRCMRYSHNSLFDTKFVKPPPLVERALRFEIDERVAADGAVIKPLTAAAIERAIATLRDAAPDCIAICLINAYANDTHEQEIKRRLAEAFPDAYLCASAEIYRGYHEFERFATTALNAYLMPPMAQYLTVLQQRIRENGVEAPIFIMGSSGGTISPRDAGQLPVRTILSGPVGGVTATIHLTKACGIDQAITYDMGGTSTDVSVIRNGEALTTNQVVYAGLPMRTGMIEINTVGAGAGSLARWDGDGALLVGPESAGASPGPACYDAGGQSPTVTDANLVLGRLNPDRPLGDRIRLRVDRSREALARLVAGRPDFTVESLAEGIVRLAVAKMVGAIREISVSRGLDPRGFTLIAYGGAGPMHAALVAADLGVGDVLIPPLPGNFSALGLLTSDLRWEMSEAQFARLDDAGVAIINRTIDKLQRDGTAHFSANGFDDQLLHEIWVEMHYTGQASQFGVRLSGPIAEPEALRRLFIERYAERYGHASQTRSIEIDAVRVITVRPGRGPRMAGSSGAAARPGAAPAHRQVLFAGKAWKCAVHFRNDIAPGHESAGPAIIEEGGATTVVPPGWRLRVDEFGNLRLRNADLAVA